MFHVNTTSALQVKKGKRPLKVVYGLAWLHRQTWDFTAAAFGYTVQKGVFALLAKSLDKAVA